MSNKITKTKNKKIRDKISLDNEIKENTDYCFCQ